MRRLTKQQAKKNVMSLWRDKQLILMAIPALTILILFRYVPMSGLVLAFKQFNFQDGLYGSPWNGWENFRFLFMSGDVFWRTTRNTVAYYALFTITETLASVMIAIGLNELVFKRSAKVMQSIMILPAFISYIAVTFVVSALLDYKNGMINAQIVENGGKAINFYMQAKYWPLILTLVNLWKGAGYGSVLYLSVLTGIDQEMYEAAQIDGANAWQKLRYITIPMLTPMITIVTLLSLGNIMESNIGLFYRMTKNVGALYPRTQTLSSYVYGSISSGTSSVANYGVSSAITLYQSVIGFIMVVVVNLIVRRKSPEHSLF